MAKVSMIIIYLAMIRTIAECFRLHYVYGNQLNFDQIRPFLIAALATAVGLLVMTLLYFSQRFTIITFIAAACIILMICLKISYHL